MENLPEGILLAWYGDDFTGSAAVMEVLTFAGVPAMLFLDVPTQEQLARYPDLKAIGVASTARAQSPEWMDSELPAIFSAMSELNPDLFHYKACSTLDSSSSVGSIGRAIEIGAEVFPSNYVPVLIAAPKMRRYQMFGHLFAGFGDDVYRLDRHPVMSRHPVTPMTESDVGLHIGQQSEKLDIKLWSLENIQAGDLPGIDSSAKQIAVRTLDCMDEASESANGRLLWDERTNNRFVVGSQGIEYALVNHWIEAGMLEAQAAPKTAGSADRMITVSGSVSLTTAQQIAWSRDNGFALIRFDTTHACSDVTALENEKEKVISESLLAISQGKDPLIFTAEGPDDPAIGLFMNAVESSGRELSDVNESLGIALGNILATVLEQSGIRRAIVSGGDTSGHATRQLGIFALSALAPTIPGAALFRAHADGPIDGLELALKGGQMGSPDYFGWIRDGGGER